MWVDEGELEKLLIKHEGLELKPYKDSLGIETIGVGRNLQDRGISKEEALFLLRNDIDICIREMYQFDWFYNLNKARQDALIDMCFNLGISRLKGFKNMLQALSEGNFEEAAKHALDSKWAEQVKGRAVEVAEMIRSGTYPAV